jgi:serine/threonine protein kinase
LKKSGNLHQESIVSEALGTLPYMPPEIVSKKKNITNDKQDIWSLGIILHEIFTSKNPFKFNEEWIINICNGDYKIDYGKITPNSVEDKIIQGKNLT